MIVFCTDATGRQDRAQPLMVSNLRMARQWAHGYNGYCRSLSADPLKLHQLPLFLVVPKLLLLAFTSGNSKSSPNIASIYTTNQCLDERRGVWKQQLVTTYGNYSLFQKSPRAPLLLDFRPKSASANALPHCLVAVLPYSGVAGR